MPTFNYRARDQRLSVQVGHLDAVDEDEVVSILQHRGLIVTSVAAKDVVQGVQTTLKGRFKSRRMHGPVRTEDHVMLCEQLATLVEAGVPLLKSFDVVIAQVESRTLLLALEEIRGDIEAGRTFRDALAKHPAIFSSLWLNLVETGETSGHLANSLNQLAHHFQAEQHLKNEMKTAMTYPMFLICAAIGVVALFVYWLIPKFTGMFMSMGMELPPLTRFVIGVSDFAKKYVVVIVGGVVTSVFFFRNYLRTESGQWMRDRLILRVPVFKGLYSCAQLAEFSRGLSTLLESGVPLLSSLEILERSLTNKVYGQAVGEIREFVKEGKGMAEPMADTGLFPPMAVQMVQVGEEVGELSKMVGRVAQYYEAKVETFISRMTKLFEPFALVFMGAFVLIIVLSIFMPIFQMAGGVKT